MEANALVAHGPGPGAVTPITIGSLFAGIGGFELGLERAGLGPVTWQAESDPYCREVLARHWPRAKRYESVQEIGEKTPRVELICGGFPCQDLSPANQKEKGLDGPQSSLWYAFESAVRGNYNRFGASEKSGDGLATRLESGGPMNPEWLEWYMGFPIGWTERGPSAMPSSHTPPKPSGE